MPRCRRLTVIGVRNVAETEEHWRAQGASSCFDSVWLSGQEFGEFKGLLGVDVAWMLQGCTVVFRQSVPSKGSQSSLRNDGALHLSTVNITASHGRGCRGVDVSICFARNQP